MTSIDKLKEHPLWPYREDYVGFLRSINDDIFNKVDNNDTITLYHGTTTAYLNSILTKGILHTEETGTSNWDLDAVEKFTYLTNKWHYFYAYRANEEYLIRTYGEEYQDVPEARWWDTLNPLPCYIECKVPKALLFADEDMILSRYVYKKIKYASRKAIKESQEKAPFTLTWEESLAQYGTVAAYGTIPPEYIKSFTVLGDPTMYLDLYAKDGPYRKDYMQWQNGDGKGKRFNMKTMIEREAKSDLNGTFWLKDLHGKLVNRFVFNPKTKKIAISLKDR